MITLIIIEVLLAAIAFIILRNIIKKRIIRAEAGPSANAPTSKSDKTFSVWNKIYDGDKIIGNVIRFEVVGPCMGYIGIKDGDVMYANKIKSPSAHNIKKFDILLLKIKRNRDNKTIYKIRMVEKINNDNTIDTFYFKEKNGVWFKKYSTIPHKFSQVQGIVPKNKIVNTLAQELNNLNLVDGN